MPNDPTLGELARVLADFRADVRDDFTAINTRLDTFVLRDVYAADRAALEFRLARMEREAEAARAAARTAIYGCIGAVLASVLAGIVLAVLLKGGR
ncbi:MULTISPECIES: hypothetical protein [Actinomadura]|uniref:Uncharacterized protein n=1 Tax=Actinomadura yumaensis TaxID=111807 RepID=A0ABW2CXC1_9ACTN|nr:hypothetical protein [Actinomadura sp. J1-007]MWK39562.1 hypothetical protein [Actinomadura sp. J1-007]